MQSSPSLKDRINNLNQAASPSSSKPQSINNSFKGYSNQESFKKMPRETSQESNNETVRKVLDVNNEIKWAVFKYDRQIITVAEGSGDLEELKTHLDESQVLYGYMRVQLGTDKRNKFVFIRWTGENARPLQKARALDDCKRVQETVKVYHIELTAMKKGDLIEKAMIDRLQQAAGANYDKEQNASPTTNSVLGLNSYKNSSKQFFQNIEKKGTLQKVVYETKALPKSTPVDLGNRQMTAAASQAKANTVDLTIHKNVVQNV